MGSVPIHYVDLRGFSYATEDDARVERALGLFLPAGYEIEREESTGHHGDRIIVFSARVENADDVRHVLDRVRQAPDFETVLDELDQRVDEDCSLFLQFDKQAAYRGDVTLGTGILLRAKIEAYPAKRDTAIENARSALSK